jgi:uncharacterized membrane protein
MISKKESLNNNRKDLATPVLAVIIFQALVDIAILLDVPVTRQILGFIYLTIVPGAIFLTLFRLHSLDFTEKLLFSIGLSVAFVMFFGLIMNQIGLLFHFMAILSAPTLVLATNSAVFFLCAVSCFLNRNMLLGLKRLDFPMASLLTICLPILAILGTTLVNFNGNSVILLLMIGLIAMTVLISSIGARTNWPLVIFMITISVLFQMSLISNYIVGYDVHPAYHAFKIAQNNGVWTSTINETDPVILRTDQMLSSTVFPLIYSNMLNVEGTWIFKIVYPWIFALVPVGLYQLYRKYMGKKAAFLAAFFILADITFFTEMPGLPAEMIGEFFLVLALIVLFHEKISSSKKMIFFTIFSAGMIVSHYGTSYVFMFLIFFVWLVYFLMKKQPKIKATYIILFFVLAFAWYIYTTQSASFTSLVDMSQNIYTNFWSELLNPQSRTETALEAIGAGPPAASIGHWLGRGFHYLAQFFIVLGVASSVLRYKNRYKFDREYVTMSVFMLMFAMLPLIAPSFNLLNVTRAYHLSLLFLAPFCVIGGELFFSSLLKRQKSIIPFILTLLVVTSLFLFEIGFIYEITRDVSYSIPLSMYRMDRATVYRLEYLTEAVDVASAEWLHSNIVLTANTLVYADSLSIYQPLTSYAVFPRDSTETLSNFNSFDANAYVYLRNFNTVDGKIVRLGGIEWNTSDIHPHLEVLDKIYSNGGSEIFFAPNETGP